MIKFLYFYLNCVSNKSSTDNFYENTKIIYLIKYKYYNIYIYLYYENFILIINLNPIKNY